MAEDKKRTGNIGEFCTVIVDARDRFSTTGRCLRTIIEHTPEDVGILVVMGGVPDELRESWEIEFADRVRFHFEPRFLNQSQSRNIGLRMISTPYALVMDNDIYVTKGWLESLVDCQKETGAMMVVPLILEHFKKIHCVGNDIYINYRDGVPYGAKTLRFRGLNFSEETNLQRTTTEYGELHCQLVEVEPTLRLGAFDEEIQEVGEVDSGLTWRKGGGTLYVEPRSIVSFASRGPMDARDIDFFLWRWDMKTVVDGYERFQEKWGYDITDDGMFTTWLHKYQKQVLLLPRIFGTQWSMEASRWLQRARKAIAFTATAPFHIADAVLWRISGMPVWEKSTPVPPRRKPSPPPAQQEAEAARTSAASRAS